MADTLNRKMKYGMWSELKRACADAVAQRIAIATGHDVDLLEAAKTGGTGICDLENAVGEAIRSALKEYGWEVPPNKP